MKKEQFLGPGLLLDGDPPENQPLVSVMIISYNNARFLYHAAKSVLSQTYGAYELTVSDDASVDCTLEYIARMVCCAAADCAFERRFLQLKGRDRSWKPRKMDETDYKDYQKELEQWLEQEKGDYCGAAQYLIDRYFPACRKLRLVRNAENLGTVKHLKGLKQDAAGQYVMFLAADDMLHDRYVIEDLIRYFEKLPDDACVLSSQCGMYDSNLQQLFYYAVTDELRPILMNSTPEELFAELADWCVVPAAGTIYKKTAFEKFGDLDGRYHIIEDWTFFLRLTRLGGKIYYYDRLTYKHRDGGVSHGNAAAGRLAKKRYLEDCIRLTREEIFPYFDRIPPKQRRKCRRRFRATRREYERNFCFQEMSRLRKAVFFLRYGEHYFPKALIAALAYFEYRSKWVFCMGTLLLLCSALTAGADVPGGYSALFYTAAGVSGLFLFLAAMASKLVYWAAVWLRDFGKALLQRGS